MTNPVLLEDLDAIHAALNPGDRFRGGSVVMTGCAGFLGFMLMNYLVRRAADLGIERVIGLDTFLLDRPVWLDALVRDYPGVCEVHSFDISSGDLAAVPGALAARYVIHGASIASPTFYRRYPVETIDGNIWGLRRILDVYRGRDTLKGLLFFSSSEIYGDPPADCIPTDEEYRGNVSCHGPRACYDESKRFGETLCWVYARHYGMPITVARPFNNYGPGMRIEDKRLPADFAKCLLEARDIVILSNGSPTRTFCYVSDAVTGYLKCLLHGRYDYFNIGIDRPETSVRGLATIYQQAGRALLGYRGEVIFDASDDPDYMTDNPNRRCPVITKARDVLGYDPQILVDQGVARYLRFLIAEQG